MAAAFTDVWLDIVNRALGRIGKGRLDTLAGDDELTQYAVTFLEEAVEGILTSRSWSITKRAELVRDVNAPVFGYSYSYSLPADLVNLVYVETEGLPYYPEGSTILTEAESVYVVYLYWSDDPDIYPAYLKKAISTSLAFLLTSALTASEQLATRMAQEASLAFEEAIRADSRRFAHEDPDPWYNEARG